MVDHRNWAVATAAAFIGLAIWSFMARKRGVGGVFLVALLVTTGSLGVTGWKGGELVYRHGLGVIAVTNKMTLDNRAPLDASDLEVRLVDAGGQQPDSVDCHDTGPGACEDEGDGVDHGLHDHVHD